MLNGKKILSVCGAVALLLGVGMNLRHSLNDYGMGTNSLSTFALAQTSSSSGSGSSSSGSGWFWTLKKRKQNVLIPQVLFREVCQLLYLTEVVLVVL